MNYVDVAATLFILWGAWVGYQKGLIAGIAGAISYIVGLILGYLFYSPLAHQLDAYFNLTTRLKPLVQSLIKLPDNIAAIPLEHLSPDLFKQLTDLLHLPMVYKTEMDSLFKQLLAFQDVPGVYTVGDSLGLLLTHFLLSVISFLIIMYLTRVVFSWVGGDLGHKYLPAPLRWLDHLLGGGWGVLKNIISLALLVFLVQPIITLGVFNQPGLIFNLIGQVQNSIIAAELLSLIHKFL